MATFREDSLKNNCSNSKAIMSTIPKKKLTSIGVAAMISGPGTRVQGYGLSGVGFFFKMPRRRPIPSHAKAPSNRYH